MILQDWRIIMQILGASSGRAKKKLMKHLKKKGVFKRLTALSLTGVLVLSGIAFPCADNVFAADDTASKLLAFPTAEGGGRFASGGRNYSVYIVTSLEDYARNDKPIEGTLRYGIENFANENGGAIIVFNVGGTIHLKQKLAISGKNITIAGQTAPGDGITIAGYDTDISGSENLIIRYMRFRPGAENVFNGGDSMDALWGRDNKTFIIDHCSFSWNTDETLSTYRGQDGTVQWCIVSESLTVSGHSKGRHGYGGIFGGNNVVFQYNLIANHTSRNPRLGGGYMGDPKKNGNIATVQVSNSVLYNWGYNTCYGGGYTYSNYINNYLKAGLGTRDKVKNQVIDAGEKGKPGGFYVNGNYLEGNETISNNNSKGIKHSGDSSGDTKTEIVNTPYEAEGFNNITLISAKDCYEPVLNKAGATYPYRDAVDARVVDETRNNKGRFINTEDEVGGYPAATVTASEAKKTPSGLKYGDVNANGVVDVSDAVLLKKHLAGYEGIEINTEASDMNVNGEIRVDDAVLLLKQLASPVTTDDSDNDGIPDAWEREHGLNPDDGTDSAKINPNTGYAYIEEYFNGLVEEVEKTDYKAANPTITLDLQDNATYDEGSEVKVTADVKANNNGTIEKVEFYNGDKVVGTANKAPFTCTYKGLTDGTYSITARAYDSSGNKTQSSVSKLHINSTASSGEWLSKDIGNTKIAGTASMTDGVLTVKGAGKLGRSEGYGSNKEWSNATTDSFHYAYQEVTGDTEIVTKLDYATVVDNHVFTGVMFRDSLEANAKTVGLGLSLVKINTSTTWSSYMVSRTKTGGNIDDISETIDSKEAANKKGIPIVTDLKFKEGPVYNGIWFKLARMGNKFTGYISENGTDWTLVGTKTVDMNDKIYVGFAVDSNKAANELYNLSTAKFSHISLGSKFADV